MAYIEMSLLPSDTFANSVRPLYAALGSGGGGSLVSPVNVVPSGGDAVIQVIAPTRAFNAAAILLNANTGVATLSMNTGAGVGTQYDLTVSAGGGQILNLGLSGQTPQLQMDGANHNIQMGDGFANSIFDVNSDVVGLGNGGGTLALNPTSATLAMGANDGVRITSAQTLISCVNNDAISITPTQATYTGQYNYQQVIGTIAAATPIPITQPNQSGLYSVMMTTTASDYYSIASCIGMVAYFRLGYGWSAGGNLTVGLNSTGSLYAQFFTAGGSGGIQFGTSATIPTLNGMGCSVVQLAGAIPGF